MDDIVIIGKEKIQKRIIEKIKPEVERLKKIAIISGQLCPKCESADTKIFSAMHPNMSNRYYEIRKCNKCNHQWEREMNDGIRF